MMRASQEQFATLVELMERYGDLARPQPGPQGRLRADHLWHEVEATLNAIGGGVTKSLEKWKKVWADWKTKTKKKALLIRRESTRTGGGPSSRLTLTALEERVLAVMGLSAVEGLRNIEERGFGVRPVSQSSQHSHSILQNEFDVSMEIAALEEHPPDPGSPLVIPYSPEEILQAATPPPPSVVILPQPAPPVAVRAPPTVRNRPLPANVEPRDHRRRRQQTPFERAVSEFAAIEDRRLKLEEQKEINYHEREKERLKIDTERNNIFLRIADGVDNLINIVGKLPRS